MVVLNEDNSRKKKIINEDILDEKNIVEKPLTKEKKIKIKSNFGQITPILDMTENDFFYMRNGEYLEILQLDSKDIYSLNESELNHDIQQLEMFFSVLVRDIKILPLNVPLNLEKQKDNMYRCLERATKDSYVATIKRRLNELEKLEKIRTNREYFILLYADTEQKLREIINQGRAVLSSTNPLSEISREKKLNIFFQLNNINTKPLQENETE